MKDPKPQPDYTLRIPGIGQLPENQVRAIIQFDAYKAQGLVRAHLSKNALYFFREGNTTPMRGVRRLLYKRGRTGTVLRHCPKCRTATRHTGKRRLFAGLIPFTTWRCDPCELRRQWPGE